MSEPSPDRRPDFDQLREVAEQRIHRPKADTLDISAEQSARLVYELEIHQEELEIQNEELRRAHLELQATRDRYVDLYDFAPVGYLTLTSSGEISEANLTACEMLGRERNRLIGSALALHCDLDSRAELRAHLDKVLTTGERQSSELRFTANGKFDVQLESSRADGMQADEDQCRMVLTDITARKQAERTAQEQTRHLRSVTDALPVLISYLDTEFRIQFSNAAYQKWFGTSPDDLRGRPIHELFSSRAHEVADYLADALDGRHIEFDSSLTHQHQGLRQVQVTLVPDFGIDGNIKGIHSLCIDITERRLVEEHMSRRRNFVERLVRLSAAEKQVYDLLIRGKSSKLISIELDIGLRTAERRRQTVLEKLEVDSVAELLQHLSDIQNLGSF